MITALPKMNGAVTGLLRLAVLVAAVLFPARLGAAASGPCLTGDCHSIPGEGASIHGPAAAGKCESCHKPGPYYKEEKHNRASFDMLPGTRLCLGCHEEIRNRLALKRVHPALMRGDCLLCHIPHRSATRFRLRGSGEPSLCFECHRDLGLRVKGSKLTHAPIPEKGCRPCHEPHGSDCEPLLAVCDTSRADEWGSSRAAGFVNLCWSCHPAENYLDPEKTVTGFRDGKRNLHQLHVVDKRRRKEHPCRRCHETHAGDTEKLIRDDVGIDRGVWTFPVHFTPAEQGGSCHTECHRDLSYDRVKPVN